jgi:hypothetical protein
VGVASASFAAGDEGSTLLLTRDAFGNACLESGARIEAVATGGSGAAARVDDNGDGTYTVHYTGRAAGEYQLAVRCNGVPVAGSPLRVVARAGAAAAASSVVRGAGLSGSTAGDSGSVVVEARDRHGNRVSSGGDRVRAELSGPASGEAVVRDGNDGTYAVAYRADTAGEYTLLITLNGIALPAFPLPVCVLPSTPSAQSSTMVQWPSHAVAAGSSSSFTLVSHDRFGNRVWQGGAPFAVELSGVRPVTCALTDQGDGTYLVRFVAHGAGSYHPVVRLAGQPDARPRRTLAVTPGVFSVKASLLQVAADYLEVGQTVTGFVHARDEFGNALVVGGAPLSAFVTGPISVPVHISDASNGTYALAFSSPIGGAYTLHVMCDGVHVERSPFAMTIHGAFCVLLCVCCARGHMLTAVHRVQRRPAQLAAVRPDRACCARWLGTWRRSR